MSKDLSIGFIGAGKTAGALAKALTGAGYSVNAVTSRTKTSADKLADRLGGTARAFASGDEVAARCGLVFVTTPDDAIAHVVARTKWRRGVMAVHCSGVLSTDVLGPVKAAGGHVGGFHPLQSFATERADALKGVTIGLEGEGPLLARLQQIAADLGARSIVVPPGGKAAYHAGAVLASNYVVTLIATGTQLLTNLGVSREAALQALLGLLGGTLQNLKDAGLPNALTGPIARGDAGTVRRHIDVLAGDPALAEAYRALGRLTIPIALAKGTLSPKAAQELERVLGTSTRPSAPDPNMTEVTLAQ